MCIASWVKLSYFLELKVTPLECNICLIVGIQCSDSVVVMTIKIVLRLRLCENVTVLRAGFFTVAELC